MLKDLMEGIALVDAAYPHRFAMIVMHSHMSFSPRRFAAAVSMVCCVACSRESGLPKVDSKEYRDLVSAFYVGLSGLQTGEDVRAREKLTAATRLAPGEPASWADLALLSVRQQNFDDGYKDAQKALSLAPGNSRVETLLGLIESKRGNLPEAIGHFSKAIGLDPANLKAMYALARETERQATGASDADAEKIFGRALAQRAGNSALLLDVARLAAKTGDANSLKSALAALTSVSSAWPAEAKQQLTLLQQAAAGPNPRDAAIQVVFLRNVLARVPQYRQDLNDVQTPATFVSDPFTTFLRLPVPTSEPAPADMGMRFEQPTTISPQAIWAGAMALDDSGQASVLWADQKGVQIVGGARIAVPWPAGTKIIGADLNYDFLNDLVIAGPAGLHIFEQKNRSHFTELHLPASIANAPYSGAWAFDVDLDGDLDIVLGTRAGPPVVLRNNGDDTFTPITPFAAMDGLTAFANGGTDVAIADGSGALHVFANERLGHFRQLETPTNLRGHFVALTPIDSNGNFMLLRDDGAVLRSSDGKPIAKATAAGLPALALADFDNNGSLDLLVNGQIFLSDGKGYTPIPRQPEILNPTAVDLNGDGRLDLIGVSSESVAVSVTNHGNRSYHWQDIRLRAATAIGDQRINSFGIGGNVQIRSGLLTQEQVIASPRLHFGLGTQTEVDVARITWPNGVVQGEFELKADEQILARQRLKGSCPWLFAWDGKQMSFVKDGSPWSPALGLHINAQVVAGIGQTQEWFKIPGESLKPHNGYYDLRITGELWETYYIDHYSLMVVDHPEGTAIYTDERFAVPTPPLRIYTTADPKPFASAHDDLGNNVAETVRTLDRNYLDTFGRGPYQGLTRDHWVELALPDAAPESGPIYLLATGWVHPTDATVNIAIGQNSIPQPRGLSIEVPDRRGRWHSAKGALGFPAGKMKTIVLELPPGARTFRLRTNLEIYWDKLEWATAAPDRNHVQKLGLAAADLHYRGFSEVKAANASSPELPDYAHVASTGQIWNDLEGYATRYGDIRELLAGIDDRIVIVNAGDEVTLRFNAPAAPLPGFIRDYVMVADGWIKDGDFNTVFSKTVLPLPYHGMKQYTAPPGRLEDDPGYKLHPDDWQKFHTRYVTADRFENALKN